MSAQPTLRRTALTIAAVAAAVLAVLLPAAPASADDTVQVSLSGLNSNETAGNARADTFAVRVNNKTKQNINGLHAAIVVHLDGLQPDAVNITRGGFAPLNRSTNGADVVFTDPDAISQLLLPGQSAQRNYQISFAAQAPQGHGQLTAIAFTGNGNQLGSANADFSLRSANGQNTPTPHPTTEGPSPSSSPAATVNVPLPTGNPVSLAPIGDGGRTTPVADSSSGVPVFIYIMGGILVAMGAAILFMLFRNPRERGGDGDNPADYPPVDPTRGPTLGYPGGPMPGGPMPGAGMPASGMPGARTNAPTAMMPVVRDQRPGLRPDRPGMDRPTAQNPRIPAKDPRVTAAGPATDPWANTGADDTIPGGPGTLPRR